jgi:sugar phosphate isomerase/epimerase
VKLGFSTLGCPIWTTEEIIEGARRYGFDGVELRMVRGQVDLRALPELAPGRIDATREGFRSAGVEVFCVDTSLRLGWLAGARRAAQLDEAQAMLELARGLHAPSIRVFGGDLDGRDPTAADLPRLYEQLVTLADLGQQAGVKVLLETHDTFSTGGAVAALLESGAGVPVGVLWDVLHSYRHRETFAETLEAVGDHIDLVHLKDAGTFSPDGFDLKLIGEGSLPIPEAVRLLQARGYDGYLSFEWEKGWHPDLAEPEVAFPHYVKVMQRMLQP